MEMQALAKKSQNTSETEQRLSSDNKDKSSSKSRYSEFSDHMIVTNTGLDKMLQNELKVMKPVMGAGCNNISTLQKPFKIVRQNYIVPLHQIVEEVRLHDGKCFDEALEQS